MEIIFYLTGHVYLWYTGSFTLHINPPGGLIQNLPVPLYVLLTGQIIQSTFLFIAVILIGLNW